MPHRFITYRERFAKPLMAGALLSSFFGATVASANPSGANVRSGNVNVTNVNSNTMHIEQLTQKAIVDWQKFGIGQGESVRFLQPNELSVILNRVVGQDPSKILGNLSANGNVFLVNPNGVFFGPNSMVNVGGLVASTLDISNEDFLNGNYKFTQDANKALSSVVNQGTITVTDGGYAVLMAPLVSNEGLIVANLGQVNLISGESATLNFDGRNLISYDVGHMDAMEPGTVVVDRETVSGLLANVIQDSNLTEAGGMVENADGTVSLVGMGDTVLNNGTIQANGVDGQDAGKIVLDSGRLTVVGSDAVIAASGQGANSDGGEIIALSHGTMKLAEGATVEAKGGDISGDGGFVDTSGYGRIILEDYVDASAVDGEAGLWLIDPEFLAIVSGGGGQLDGDTDVTAAEGGQSSSISENFLEGLSGTTNVQLTAGTQITVNDLADDLLSLQDNVSLTLTSNTGDILFADPNDGIRVGGTGDLTIDSGRDLYLGTLISEGSGAINLAYDRNLFDGNGPGVANVVGDFLSFDVTQGDLETNLGALEIAGFTNSDPLSIALDVGNGRQVDLRSVGGFNGNPVVTNNLDISSSGVLTSDNLSGTDINIDKSGNLTINGFQAQDVVIDATGNVSGGGAAIDITAVSADIDADNINNLDTDVAVLDVQARNNNSNISLTTVDASLTDLTIRSNNSSVTVDGASVTSGTGSPTDLEYTDGAVANSFTFIESATRDLFIGAAGVEADSVTIQTNDGSILRALGGGTITSDTISLIVAASGGSIGEFTTPAPVFVEGQGGGTTALSITVVDGPVNIEHTDGDPSFVTFNNPADAEADLLLADDPGADSFSSLSFSRTGAGDIVVGQLGSAVNPLTSVSLFTANGSILNSTVAFGASTTNIFSNTLSLVALGGSVGLAADPIEIVVSDLTAQGDNGVFITNVADLESFSLISDVGSDALISANNGSLSLIGGVLSTPLAISDINTGEAEGDTDGDGYNVTFDVTLTGGGDVSLGSITVDGSDGPGAGVQGAVGDSLIRVTHQAGSIDGGGPINATGDTDVHLVSQTASVGGGTQISMNTDVDSPGELLLDAVTVVDVNVTAGEFDVVTIQHDDADVDFVGTSGSVDSDGGSNGELIMTGNANVSTINYINRTGDILLDTRPGTPPPAIPPDEPGIQANGSDLNITALDGLGLGLGNITGVLDTIDDIDAGANTVTINAAGDFAADATSTAGAGSLDLVSIGGNATVRNNNGLDLNASNAGTIGGDLDIDNDATLEIGAGGFVGLTVGGTANLLNSDTIQGDLGVGVDLVASNLTVTTDAVNTDLFIDTDIANSIRINDRVADGGGDADQIRIFNADGFNNLTVCSDSSDDIQVTTDGATAANSFDMVNGDITATDPDISTVDIEEKTDNIDTIGTASFNQSSNVTINASGLGATLMGDYNVTAGGTRNLTLLADDAINVTTTVQDMFALTSRTGTITFTDDQINGPADLIVTTEAGQTVDGEWDGGGSTMDYISVTDRFLLTDLDAANTNVTFQTDTDSIDVDFADVGDCRNGDQNDLTLIATTGAISDEADSGTTDPTGLVFTIAAHTPTDPDLDLRGENVILLAQDDIGGAPTGNGSGSGGALEVDVCDTLTARSDNGGVFMTSNATVQHVIVDVQLQDYNVTFQEFDGAGGPGANSFTVDYDGSATGTLSVTNSGGGNAFTGTDLTLIERGLRDVEIGTNMDNTGNGDFDADQEFVRIITGGGITNTSNSVITTDNADVIANFGDIGTAANSLLFAVEDICVSANGIDAMGFVENLTTVRNLYLSVNQTTGGTGDVSVIWDEGGTTRGVQMAGTVLNSVSDLAGTGGDVGSASSLVVNGSFELDGEFYSSPIGNTETFSRINDSLGVQVPAGPPPAAGGDVTIGTYVADNSGLNPFGLDPSLEVQARGAGSIIQQAGGSIDLTGGGNSTSRGTVTLVAEEGAIGTIANPIEILSDNANTTIVRAYTGNETTVSAGTVTTDEAGDININATNDVEYEQVIGGTNLTFLAPFHDNNQPAFTPGGVQAPPLATPGVAPPTPPREGDVIITSDGEICATDVRAGADSDVYVYSSGPGDILVGTVAAAAGTVTMENDDGNIFEKINDTNGNIFAQEFVGTTNGVGDIGSRASRADKETNALDTVVLETSLNVADGNVYIRNVGNIIYNDVQVENANVAPDGFGLLDDATLLTSGEVYLVSEGVTTAGNVQVGATTDVNVLIETKNGSQMLIGNVEAVGNTVALKSADRVRGDALDINDNPFSAQGRVQADQVLIESNGEIGTAATPITLFASTDGGTVTVAASTRNGSPATTGSIFLDAGSDGTGPFATFATDLVVGTVADLICVDAGGNPLLQESGVVDAEDICIDVQNGTLTLVDNVEARDDVALEASGDVTLGSVGNPTGNDGEIITTAGSSDVGVESQTGSIIDGNGNTDNITVNNGDIALRAGGAIGGGDEIEISNSNNGTIDFAAQADNGEVDVFIDSNEVDVENFSGGGNPLKDSTAINGVSATGDICLEVTNTLDLNSTVAGGGDIYLSAGGGISVGDLISTTADDTTVANTDADVILESGGNITDGNAGLDIDAGNGGDLILIANGGIGSDAAGNNEGPLEIDADTLAAAAGTGDVNVDDQDNHNDDLTIISSQYTNKGGFNVPVIGARAGEDVCIETAGALNINEDVVAGTDGTNGAGNVALLAVGTITIGDDTDDEVRTTDAGQTVSIQSTGGSIVDNNGDNKAAAVALGGNVVLSADGDIGTTDFAGTASLFEIDTLNLAANSGGDVNVVDRDSNSDGLDIETIALAKGGGNVVGVQATNDVCIDVLSGALTLNQSVGNDVTAADGSGVALESRNGDIILQNGADVINNADDDVAQQAVTSLEAGDEIRQIGAGSSVQGANVVLEAENGIGETNDDVAVVADNVAAVSSTAGDVNVILSERTATNGVTTAEITTLKGGDTVTGISAAVDVCIDVSAGDLHVIQDVVSGTAAGGTGNVAIRGVGDVLIGQAGLNAGQVRTTDTGQTVSIETIGDILDENNTDFAAVQAIGGTVVLQSDDGNIGNATFVATGPAVGTKFEVDTLNIAAEADVDNSVGGEGDVNIADLDSNADGLNIVSGLSTSKDGDAIDGVVGAQEVCIDVVNGDLNVDAAIVSLDSSVALRTQDVDFATDPNAGINLNGFDLVANQNGGPTSDPGGARISLESSGDIVDTVDAAGTLIAGNVVMIAEDGIGDTGEDVEINATNLAALNSISGDINIQDVGGGVNVAEDLFTIKDGTEVDGIDSVENICLDVVGDLTVSGDIVGGLNVALESTGNMVLGDAAGAQSGQVIAGDDLADGQVSTVSIEAGGSVTDGNAGAVNITAQRNDGGVFTPGGDLVVTTGGSFGDADFTNPAAPAGDAIEADIARVAAISGGDFNLEDVSGSLEIAEGLNTLKTPEINPIDGVTAGEDICIDVSDTTNVANLFVNADLTADDLAAGTINNIALAADDNVILGDSAGAEDGVVRAGADALNGNNTGGAQPNGVVSVEARNGAVLDGQQDDGAGPPVARTRNIINRGGDTVLIGMLGVGDNAGPDQTPAVNPDPISGVPAGDVQDQIEIDTTRFAAEATMGTVDVVDVDTDADGLDITQLNNLKDGRVIDGISAFDICIEVVNQDLIVDENIIAARNVSLRTNQNVVLGDNVGPTRGVIVAGAGKDLTIGNADDIVGNVSIEATGGDIIDGNGDSRVDTDGDGFADGANIIATGDLSNPGGTNTSGGFVVLDASGGIGSDGTGGADDAIEIDALSLAAEAGTGDVNITEQDIVTQDGLSIGEHITQKSNPQTITGVTANVDVCVDVEDGDLRINDSVTATSGDVALRTQQLVGAPGNGNGDIRFGDDTAVGGDAALETVTAGTDATVSVEAFGDAIDDNGVNNSAIVVGGDNGMVVFNANDVSAVTNTDAFEIDAATLSANARTGNVLIDDQSNDLRIITKDVLKTPNTTIVGVTAAGDVCIDVELGALEVDEDVTAGDDVALEAETSVTLGDDGVDNGEGTTTGVVTAGNDGAETGVIGVRAVNGDVTDGNGDAAITGDNLVTDGGGGVSISAGTDIGSVDNVTPNDIETDTTFFAATATTGDVNVTETDRITQDGLDIDVVTDTLKGIDNTGVTAGDDICIDVEDGDLNINDDVTAGGDVALRTNNNGNGNGDIVFGDDNAAVGADADVVTGGTDATVSVEAFADAVDNNGVNNSAIVVGGDNGMVVFNANDVSAVNNTDAFEIDAATLSANARTGNVLIDDQSNDLRIITKDVLKTPNTTIVGVTAAGDVCIDVELGALEVDEDVTAGDDVALEAETSVTLGDDGVDNGEGTTTGVVTAGNDGAETGVIGVRAVNGDVTDGNGDAAITGDNLVTDGGGGVSISAGTDIGSVDNVTPNDIETDTTFFAATATTGDVNVTETDRITQDGLDIDVVTDTLKGIDNTGVTAGDDICIDVEDGDLNINDDVTAGGDVALRTNNNGNGNGDIVFGDDNAAVGADADVVTGGTDATVSVEAFADAVDNNGVNNSAIVVGGDNGMVVFNANDVSAVNNTDAFEIDAATLSANARTGNVLIDDQSNDLRIITKDVLKTPNTTIVGVTAAGDVCIDVELGALEVDEDVTAGDDVALEAETSVTLGDDGVDNGEGTTTGVVTAGNDGAETGVIGVRAVNGDVTDGNGDAAITGDNLVTDAGGGVSISAGTDIGSVDNVTPNDIETDTTFFAATATTGDVNVTETDRITQDGLDIDVVTDTLKGIDNTGVTAGDDICIDVEDGDLNINDDVTAGGDVALRTNNNGNGNGDIVFGDDNAAVGADADVVTGGTDATVSVEAFADAVDNNGVNNSAIVVGGDNGMVVFNANDVSAVNNTDAFEIDAATLSANARTGNVLIDDQSNDLRIITKDVLKTPNTTIVGVTAAGDVCIDVELGALEVDEDVTAGDDVALEAETSVTLGDDGVDNGEGTTTGVVTAGNDGAETGVIGVRAVNGDVTDGNGDAAITGDNLVTDGGGGVSISAGTGIGDVTGGNNIETDTTFFAANAANGDVNVTETDFVTQDGLDVDTVNDTLKGINNTGVTATANVCIDVLAGALDINQNVTGGTNVDLRTQDAGGNGDVNVNNSVVTATAGDITVDSADDLVDNNGLGNAALVAGGNAILDVGDELRSTEPAPDGEFEIDTAGLAARVGTGNVDVADLSGDLEIVEGVTGKDGDTIDGVTAPGQICIDVRDGSLEIAQQITSADDNVALQATGDITITGADDVTADSNGGAGTVSVEAGDEILDTGDGSFVGQDVVLESVNGIGADAPVTIDATNLAADGGTGRANITDIAGGVTVTTLDTLKGGDTITGVSAAEDVCLQVVGGDLIIDEVVSAGTVAAIQADGSIASNATVTGVEKVSVQSGGDIVDGNDDVENFVGSQMVVSADGDIGSKTNAIDIDSDEVAAQSLSGEVNLNETNGDMTIGTIDLEKNGGTVSGVSAATDICLTADDGTLVYTGQSLTAESEIAVRVRDTLTTSGFMTTGPDGRISVEVTNGAIQDNNDNDGVDFQTKNLVLKAQSDIGSEANRIETNVDMLAAQAETGDIYLFEQDGLKITELELAKGGGLIDGVVAGNDVNIIVDKGDLGVDLVTAGNDVILTAEEGDIKDCNDGDLNIDAGGDVELNAPLGCVEDLEIEADGSVTFNDTKIRNFQPEPLILPPGVFAQDNVKLGESSFYLDVLYGYLVPEELDLIMDELEAYDFWNDKDFLLEKHPTGEREDDNEDEDEIN